MGYLHSSNCRDNFDVQKLIEAAQMFVGKHDFRTFMSINNDAHVCTNENSVEFQIEAF